MSMIRPISTPANAGLCRLSGRTSSPAASLPRSSSHSREHLAYQPDTEFLAMRLLSRLLTSFIQIVYWCTKIW